MPLAPIDLGTGSNVGRTGFESAARHINAYVYDAGSEAKTRLPIVCRNGMGGFATYAGAAGGIRAMLTLDTTLLTVADRLLFSTAPNGTVTEIGGIPTDGFVTMARNMKTSTPQVAIVVDGSWFIYEGGSVVAGSDPDLPPPNSVTHIGGYFVFTIGSSGRFYWSAANDGTSVDGLSFANAESNADGLFRGVTRGRELVLLGPRSIEFWDLSGNNDAPFSFSQSLNFGALEAGSVCEITALIDGQMTDSVAFCGTNEQGSYTGVHLLAGYGTRKISTPGIDKDVQDLPDKSAMRGFSWAEDGHVFYALRSPTFCHVYDTTLGTWHERSTYGSETWGVSCAAEFAGKILFGDADTEKVYQSERNGQTDDGRTLLMQVQGPIVHAFPKRIRVDQVHIDAVCGVGLNSTQEHLANPEIMLDYSEDGGRTFDASTQRKLPLGRQGQYQQQLSTRGLGIIRRQGRTFRLSASAAVLRQINSMYSDVTPLG